MTSTWTERHVRARLALEPLHFFLSVTSVMWVISACGTYIDLIQATQGWSYRIFQALVLLWAFWVLIIGLSGLLGEGDPCCAKLVFRLFQAMTFVATAVVTLYKDVRNYHSIGGFPNFFLLLSIGIMVFNTLYCIVVYDLLNTVASKASMGTCCKLLVLLVRRYVLLLFIAPVAMVALSFFFDNKTDYTLGAARSRNLNAPCLVAMYDGHDLWHLLAGIVLGLWVKIVLSVKVHFYTEGQESKNNFGRVHSGRGDQSIELS